MNYMNQTKKMYTSSMMVVETAMGNMVNSKFAQGSLQSQPLSRFSFVRYKQSLLDKDFAVTTINKKINSLKVYNDFLQKKGLVDENYIQLKKDQVKIASGSEHMVTALSKEEVERLLFYLEEQTKVSGRNKLIAYILLYTGIRVTELVNIKLADIDALTSSYTVQGKGGKVREIIFEDRMCFNS